MSPVADERARRAASRASCCRQTGRQCNKLSSTVANIVSLIDSDGPVYQAERQFLSSRVDNTLCDYRHAVEKFSKSRVRNKLSLSELFLFSEVSKFS